jgi:4-hydroxysphinganine ceramide fatty acyl 2-hydroxylase
MIAAVIFFVLGMFGWSFGEYAMHNWRGHLGKGRNDFSREHLAHHRDVTYFAATAKKALVAAFAMVLIAPLAIVIIGFWGGSWFSLGFISFYVYYEVLHRRTHTHAPWNAYARWARKHHMFHHFGSAKMNHGVTTPIWDVVFGTYVKPGIIRVPERQVMDWLLDPATGEVKEQYRDDYELVRKRRRPSRTNDVPAPTATPQPAL